MENVTDGLDKNTVVFCDPKYACNTYLNKKKVFSFLIKP